MYVLLDCAASSAGRQQQIRATISSNKTHSGTLALRSTYLPEGTARTARAYNVLYL
jgi:hypothetical protein